MLRILDIRPFRNLWLGQAISQLGDSLYFLTFLFMAQKITGKSEVVGMVGAAQALPFLLLAPYAGALADRMDRRKIMLGCDVASAALLALFGIWVFFDSTPPAWSLVVMGALLSSVNVLFLPAKSAAIPRLVPTERLMEATSLSMATQSLMPLIGLGLSGGVLGAIEAAMPKVFFETAIVTNMLSFLVSAAYIRLLEPITPEREHHEIQNPIREMVEGVQIAWKHPVIKVVLILSFFFSLFVSPFMVVYVDVNKEWFGGHFWTLAAFEGGFIGMMLVTSLWMGRRRFARPGITYLLGCGSIGLFVILMAYSKSFGLFLLFNLLCGIGVPLASLPISNYLLVATEDRFRGRIQSLFAIAGQAPQPIGALMAGYGLASIKAFGMFWVMGGGMLGVCLLAALSSSFRNIRMPETTEEPSADSAQDSLGVKTDPG